MRILAVVTLLALLPPSGRAAIPGAEDPKASNGHDHLRALHEFNRRTMSGAYLKVGKRNPAWDEPAQQLLDATARYFTYANSGNLYRAADTPTIQDLMPLVEAALTPGCDDPLVRYCYGVTLQETNRLNRAQEVLPQVADELYASRYPLHRAIAAGLRLARFQKWMGDVAAAQKSRARAFDALLALLVQPDLRDDDRRFYWSAFGDDFNDAPLKEQADIYARAQQLRPADPWLLNMLGGVYHINAAWAGRGAGWARDVTPQGWKTFNDEGELARRCLVAAWKLRPDYPEPAAMMIRITMGTGEQKEGTQRQWFDRAVGAQIDYGPAYSAYFWNLRPRWGGSYEQMYAFGVECLESERYDTGIPFQLIVALQDITADKGDASYWQRPGVYEKVSDYFAKQVAACKEPSDANWYRCYHAAAAWRNGKYAEARRLLDQAQQVIAIDGFDRMYAMPGFAMSQVYAMSGPHAARLAEAARAGALSTFQDVLGAMKPDDYARHYVAARAAELAWRGKFEAGEWVDIQPTADFACWEAQGGNWSVDEQKRLVCTVDGGQQRLLCHTNVFGENYEFEGVVEFPNDVKFAPNGGPLFAHRDGVHSFGVLLRHRAGELSVAQGGGPVEEKAADVPDRCAFRIRLRDRKVSVEVNGKLFFENCDLNRRYFNSANQQYVGLSGFNSTAGTLRFTGLRVRKLGPE
jgi:hypothetical protein